MHTAVLEPSCRLSSFTMPADRPSIDAVVNLCLVIFNRIACGGRLNTFGPVWLTVVIMAQVSV